jgi:hypothetical protein
MERYRCYFLDGVDAIRDVATFECSSDALAKDRALELLKDCRFPKVELWLLDRRLYQAAKEQQTAARGVQTRDPP